MGLFDFFKKKQTVVVEHKLDDALRDAVRNRDLLPDFYRMLLSENIYVMADAKDVPNFEPGVHTVKDLPVEFNVYERGALAIFSTPERIFDNGIIKKDEYTLTLIFEGRIFLSKARHHKVIINPYSDDNVLIAPAEINELLKANIHIGNQNMETVTNNISTL